MIYRTGETTQVRMIPNRCGPWSNFLLLSTFIILHLSVIVRRRKCPNTPPSSQHHINSRVEKHSCNKALLLVQKVSVILQSAAIKGQTHDSVMTEGQKYHLEDEGDRPTDADCLVEAQLQILTRREEKRTCIRPSARLGTTSLSLATGEDNNKTRSWETS